MNYDRSKIIYSALGFFVTVLLLFLSYSRVFDEFEYSALDFRFKIRPPQAVDNEIVIIHIGDDTIEKLGEWPIPRKYHALLLKALKSAGVRTVVFDVFFSEKTEDDEGFAAAVKEAGNVYLPYIFELKSGRSCKRCVSASRFIAPLIDVLKSAAKGTGFINIEPDMDGKVRHIIPFIEYKGKFYPYLTVLAALNDLGLSFNPAGIVPGRRMTAGKNFVIPLEGRSTMLVNYPARWGKAFRHYSYVDILQSHLSGLIQQEPAVALDELKDTVCFVGFTATASPDAHPSPCEPLYPGVGVHASIYNSIVQKDFLCRLSRWWNLPLLIVLWLLTGYFTVRSRKRSAFLSIVLILAAYLGIAVLCFCLLRVWIDVIYPSVTMVGVYMFFT
ncbi:MAG: CHASE2 domain-containing protein, partial [Candidatus Omnitrophica bacterium]|nr:CHASE2 domain-containing protein [Candidatus Omnitrophota bacterium]